MKNTERENLLAELDLHKLEYTSLRNELAQITESSKQYLNLNLVAIAAAFGFFPFLLEKQIFITLLAYPFLFHVLFQRMLSDSKQWWQIESYVALQLIPRVNYILDELGSQRTGSATLGWETIFFYPILKKPNQYVASLVPTEGWIPILTISGLLISYAAAVNIYHYPISLVEIVLFLINISLLVFVMIQSGTVARKEVRNTQKLALSNGFDFQSDNLPKQKSKKKSS